MQDGSGLNGSRTSMPCFGQGCNELATYYQDLSLQSGRYQYLANNKYKSAMPTARNLATRGRAFIAIYKLKHTYEVLYYDKATPTSQAHL